MQLLKKNLDGSSAGAITDLTIMTPQEYVAFAVSESDGFHVVVGANIGSPDRGGKSIYAVASNGVLIVQNIVSEEAWCPPIPT